jgi:hypothetical protein
VTSAESRSGVITVAGQSFNVMESGSALSFRLDPLSVDVRIDEGSSPPERRVVAVIPSTPGARFSVTAPGGPWLTITPSAGIAPGSIVVTVNAAGLVVGTYRGSVVVRIATATPPEQTVPIVLTVAAKGTPKLDVDPLTLTVPTTQGQQPRTDVAGI